MHPSALMIKHHKESCFDSSTRLPWSILSHVWPELLSFLLISFCIIIDKCRLCSTVTAGDTTKRCAAAAPSEGPKEGSGVKAWTYEAASHEILLRLHFIPVMFLMLPWRFLVSVYIYVYHSICNWNKLEPFSIQILNLVINYLNNK